MSQPCGTPKCERVSRGLCDCCKQTLCLQHLTQHNELLVSQLNPLIDEINALGDRLKSFNIDETTNDSRQRLEQWRIYCHKQIDRFFEEKCQELDRLVTEKLDSLRKQILHIQSKMVKLVREQEATRQDIDSLTSTVRQLEKAMQKIEEINIQINTHLPVMHDSLVQIRETNDRALDLANLLPVHRTLSSPGGSSPAMANSEQFLLIHRNPNLCFIDKDMNIMKQVLWEHKKISDMCWSSTLGRFIVVEENSIFLVDERTMSIETIEAIEKREWLLCTCSDTSLFLSTNVWGSSIVELVLSPSVAIIKEWKSPITCTKDECINGMSHQRKMCAVVIKNKVEKSVRIELRFCETMARIWSLPLNIVLNQTFIFYCCSLNCNEWLVVDYETKRLLHITKDGKLKTDIPCNGIPCCAQLFGSDTLAVSTVIGINLHKI